MTFCVHPPIRAHQITEHVKTITGTKRIAEVEIMNEQLMFVNKEIHRINRFAR